MKDKPKYICRFCGSKSDSQMVESSCPKPEIKSFKQGQYMHYFIENKFKEVHCTIYALLIVGAFLGSIVIGALFLLWGIQNYSGAWYERAIDIALIGFMLFIFWGIPACMATIGLIEFND